MAQMLKVAEPDEVPPGKGKTVLVAGREVTVYNEEGRYVATSTWSHHLGGPSLTTTETTCEMPGHRFDADIGDSPARLRSDVLRYQVVVESRGIFIVVEEGHVHPGDEPRIRARSRRHRLH